MRWCSCRVENILTLGKLIVKSVVLFPPPFYFVFDISNLLSYIQNNFSYELARPIMGTIFLVYILGMCSFQHKWASEHQLYLFVLLHHVLMK